MFSPLEIFFLAFNLCFGLLCLISPMLVARVIVWWPKFIFGKILPKVAIRTKLKHAMYLMENDQKQYAIEFYRQIKIIRITGLIAILIFLQTLCVVSLSSIAK